MVNKQKANWKMAIEIVDCPIKSMVDLSIVLLVYQRVGWSLFQVSIFFLLQLSDGLDVVNGSE
jgi:hypothetical protein